jgi:hypothetical protein
VWKEIQKLQSNTYLERFASLHWFTWLRSYGFWTNDYKNQQRILHFDCYESKTESQSGNLAFDSLKVEMFLQESLRGIDLLAPETNSEILKITGSYAAEVPPALLNDWCFYNFTDLYYTAYLFFVYNSKKLHAVVKSRFLFHSQFSVQKFKFDKGLVFADEKLGSAYFIEKIPNFKKSNEDVTLNDIVMIGE